MFPLYCIMLCDILYMYIMLYILHIIILCYSEASNEAFKSWSKHDDAQNKFCQLDGEFVTRTLMASLYCYYICQKEKHHCRVCLQYKISVYSDKNKTYAYSIALRNTAH